MLRSALIALLIAALPAAISAQEPKTPPFAPAGAGTVVVYRGANLIDGTAAPLRAGMAVVTEGPRIKAVLPDRAVTPAMLKGATVVDVAGGYLLPGLIDSHEHLATPPNAARAKALMRRDLYGGVTAVRIMADDLRSIAELARQANVGEIEGPDPYFAALVAGKSFFDDPRTAAAAQGYAPGTAPWMQAVTAETDLAAAIAVARGTGASGLKIYAELPGDLIARITAEAHRQGLPVWAHGMVFPTPPAEVIAAGPDVVSHTCYLAYQLSDPRPETYRNRFPVDYAKFASGDTPEMAALFREMKRRGIVLDPTLRVYAEMDARAAADPKAKPYHCTLDLAARLTNQAWREGVPISAGTDGFTAWDDPWSPLHEELVLLARKAGMPPADVIRAATAVGARAVGRETDMGTVSPGKLANLVVLDRNPLDDIANIRSVRLTVKQGRRYERADYRPITREEISEDE